MRTGENTSLFVPIINERGGQLEEVTELVEKMRGSPYIREKMFGPISSFNFTKGAFYGNHWDDLTVCARGLFIDREEMRIVARGYNKFFYLTDNMESLPHGLTYPLRIYRKENGFLGLIGWNHRKDDFLFCSKSMCNEGPYVEMLKKIFYSSGVDLQAAKDLTKRVGVTIIVEAIDPVNDPHIIEYEKPQLILLDLMFNDLSGRTIAYDFMRGWWAKKLNIEPKEFCWYITNEEQLWANLGMIDSIHYTENGKPIEGYVVHDSNNRMYKVKTGYYTLWKRRRWTAEAILNDKAVNFTHMSEDDFFLNWVALHKKELCGKNIIEIRKLFYGDEEKK